MFTRILYPTDFSEVSRKALEYVKKVEGSWNQGGRNPAYH